MEDLIKAGQMLGRLQFSKESIACAAVLLERMQRAFLQKTDPLEPDENEGWLQYLCEELQEKGHARVTRGVGNLLRTWKREYGKARFPLYGELADCIPAAAFRGTYEAPTEEEKRACNAARRSPEAVRFHELLASIRNEKRRPPKRPEAINIPTTRELAETLANTPYLSIREAAKK